MEPQSPADTGQTSLAFIIRKIVREASRASLGTLLAKGGGPYVSLVTVATDYDGSPLLLLSTLADHTRNILQNPQVSLLFDATLGFSNPQQGPRVSLEGTVERENDERAKRRFLARHPGAALYAGFADFALYRVKPIRAHWVGGFGKARWIENDLTVNKAIAETFVAAEDALLEQINGIDTDLATTLANTVLRRRGKKWRAVAADSDGIDLARGPIVARLSFEKPLDQAQGIKDALAALEPRGRVK